MVFSCPICQKRHRAFPTSCYTEVSSKMAHVVISRLAGGALTDKDRKIEQRMNEMETYCDLNNWDEPKVRK